MNYKQLNQVAAFWGLVASGLLILAFVIYLIYVVFAKKVNLRYETVLTLLLLAAIAIGIHSLQHEGQAAIGRAAILN